MCVGQCAADEKDTGKSQNERKGSCDLKKSGKQYWHEKDKLIGLLALASAPALRIADCEAASSCCLLPTAATAAFTGAGVRAGACARARLRVCAPSVLRLGVRLFQPSDREATPKLVLVLLVNRKCQSRLTSTPLLQLLLLLLLLRRRLLLLLVCKHARAPLHAY